MSGRSGVSTANRLASVSEDAGGVIFGIPPSALSRGDGFVPTALLETKLFVPRPRRGVVSRPRLSERLNHGTASKLMLVSAPAGFGKTTLLAEWLAARSGAPTDERQVAWLSLDPRDNDPAVFWPYFVAAVQTVSPGVGTSTVALLESARPVAIEV